MSAAPPAWRSSWWPWLGLGIVLAVALTVAALGARPPATASEQVAAIGQTISCPTCNGESVAQSDADIAKEIRLDLAQRIQRGETPEDVREVYATRYGTGILLTPQSSGVGGLVWILPVVVLVLAVAGVVLAFRRWRGEGSVQASDEDRALVAHALHDDPPRGAG